MKSAQPMQHINTNEKIWVEKYRPSTLDDLILPSNEYNMIKGWLDSRNIPNILLTSQNPGTGKTSLAHILINSMEADVLWLNASKESGIDVVRNEINDFAGINSMFGAPKIVVLDEVDGLSMAAQSAMRSLIEEYTDVNYILTANYKHKIHEAIQNRMVPLDLDTIMSINSKEIAQKIYTRLEFILQTEGIEYESTSLQKLILSGYPSIRGIIQDVKKYSINGVLTIDDRLLQEKGSLRALVDQLKMKNYEQARKLIGNMINPTDIYDYLYNNIDDVIEPDSIPPVVMKIHKYMVNSTRNPEVSVSAFAAEMMFDKSVKFKL